MIFLHPIWLFALGALIIPVAIHLWNTRRGKTLKIGSISLINAASQKRSFSLKVTNLLLLLLRCLLLTLLTLVLTMPFWIKHHNASQIKGWVLIPKEEFKESYPRFKSSVDSLVKAGFEFHYFNRAFARADISQALADTTKYKGTNTSYWSLLPELDMQVPASLPVYLFTSNQATHFRGEKPHVASNFSWQTYTPADSVNAWIANAYLSNDNEIQVTVGGGKTSRTSFKSYSLRSGDQQTPFVVHTENGKLSVGLKNSSQTLNVDTSTWRFAIYAEKNSPDAQYVKAALQAIVQFTKHKSVIQQYAEISQIKVHQSWFFWLSAKPVNRPLDCDNLFSFENGKVKNVNSWINAGAAYPQKITLYKSLDAQQHTFAIWKDGFDNPVLGLERQSKINHYHFYNHFDPAWSDLVWSDQFPEMLLKLIVGPNSRSDLKYDKRILTDKQIMPVRNYQSHISTASITNHIDLSAHAWLLLMLIFIAERWLAHKKTAKQTVDA